MVSGLASRARNGIIHAALAAVADERGRRAVGTAREVVALEIDAGQARVAASQRSAAVPWTARILLAPACGARRAGKTSPGAIQTRLARAGAAVAAAAGAPFGAASKAPLSTGRARVGAARATASARARSASATTPASSAAWAPASSAAWAHASASARACGATATACAAP